MKNMMVTICVRIKIQVFFQGARTGISTKWMQWAYQYFHEWIMSGIKYIERNTFIRLKIFSVYEISLTVQLLIFSFPFQMKPNCKYNASTIFCNKIKTMRFFLHAFSLNRTQRNQGDKGRVCLAYAFTYRDITDFQGIAWIKVGLIIYSNIVRD